MNFFKKIELIARKYCIGCGICTVVGRVAVDFDEYGKYQIEFNGLNKNECSSILKVCPFSSFTYNEDQIAPYFFDRNIKKNPFIGHYLTNYIGHIENEERRLQSSSGGIITWLLLNLLKQEKITQAVFVGENNSKKSLFEYKISANNKDIIEGASSKYYPVELSKVLAKIQEKEGKYAIVALPCFAKGIRLLQIQYPVFRNRIKFVISPVCGHLKTKHYANFLALQKGFNPENLIGINFRKKLPNSSASQYGTEFRIKEEEGLKTYTLRNSSFDLGTDWGHGMFKYPACDYCDDVFGELADISVGDAWLKNYVIDYKGNSIITNRNSVLQNILQKGMMINELILKEVNSATIVASQAGGVRNKREDLAYRLYLKKKNNEWYPEKRVKPDHANFSEKRKKIIKQRIKISQLSHEVYKQIMKDDRLDLFFSVLTPEINIYRKLYSTKVQYIKSLLKGLLKKVRIIS